MKKMNNIPQNILEILSAYISQEITENEFTVLKEWIDECPENKHAFAEYLLFYKKTRDDVLIHHLFFFLTLRIMKNKGRCS